MRTRSDQESFGANVLASNGNFIGRQKVGVSSIGSNALVFVKFAITGSPGSLNGEVFPGANTRIIVAKRVRA